MSASKKQKTAPEVVYHEPKVMAEIGCNHMGDLDIAKELLTLAKNCGCEYGKFQKRCPKELLTKEQYEAPHPNPRNSYGDTYGAHREFLERFNRESKAKADAQFAAGTHWFQVEDRRRAAMTEQERQREDRMRREESERYEGEGAMGAAAWGDLD